MAEFCLDCWNRIMDTNDPPKKYLISKELELCEGCGEYKHVIVRAKDRYHLFKCLSIKLYLFLRKISYF